MVKREREGQVYYVHQSSRTIVSEIFLTCEAIKLIEDFSKMGNGTGTARTKIKCKSCEGEIQ
ncbi:hypothetical protein DC421_25280 [Priestia megaterium]|nr:hypothetical protein DC428_25290 [Priestia megaterium]PVE79550.1 hypothetical protein DC421_25280 [Priestia megaterium]PVE81848.1 hypothetical protein DC426_23945 [Priestia megaterium]PVE94265.1 hypothetical protein DC433_25770 [Priestia megaterium]